MDIGDDTSNEGEIVSDTESEIEEGEIVFGAQQVMENDYILEFFETKSEKEKSLLSRGGFEFNFENESRTMEGIEYWRCVSRNGYCPGRIHVISDWRVFDEVRFKLGKIVNENHNHGPNPENQSVS